MDATAFEYHIKNEHYMWSYVYYKAYLSWKDETDYNGNETYIMDLIKNKETKWFPIGRAMCQANIISSDNA